MTKTAQTAYVGNAMDAGLLPSDTMRRADLVTLKAPNDPSQPIQFWQLFSIRKPGENFIPSAIEFALSCSSLALLITFIGIGEFLLLVSFLFAVTVTSSNPNTSFSIVMESSGLLYGIEMAI